MGASRWSRRPTPSRWHRFTFSPLIRARSRHASIARLLLACAGLGAAAGSTRRAGKPAAPASGRAGADQSLAGQTHRGHADDPGRCRPRAGVGHPLRALARPPHGALHRGLPRSATRFAAERPRSTGSSRPSSGRSPGARRASSTIPTRWARRCCARPSSRHSRPAALVAPQPDGAGGRADRDGAGRARVRPRGRRAHPGRCHPGAGRRPERPGALALGAHRHRRRRPDQALDAALTAALPLDVGGP